MVRGCVWCRRRARIPGGLAPVWGSSGGGGHVKAYRILGIGAVAVVAAAITSVLTGAVHAAAPAVIYVNNSAGTPCSDSGAGTAAQPFCTITAAQAGAVPGQTVLITSGPYDEHLTITRSGTPDAPITYEIVSGLGPAYVQLAGADGGLTIDGVHDVVLRDFQLRGTATDVDAVMRDSTRLSLIRISAVGPAATTGVRIERVTDSTIDGMTVTGQSGRGVTLDAATSAVALRHVTVVGSRQVAGASGIDIGGVGDQVIDARILSSGGAGIAVGAGARDTVVADVAVTNGRGEGIRVAGAAGVAITNSASTGNCAAGISVTGAATGVSIQNTVATRTPVPAGCVLAAPDISVSADSTAGTTVDYNTVYHTDPSRPAYVWGATSGDLAAFRAASGQGAHDLQTTSQPSTDFAGIDSANAAAAGVQATDMLGHFAEDDPNVPDTGTGPLTYLDRGPTEFLGRSTAMYSLTPSDGGRTVSVDATGSVDGWAPAKIVSFTVDFGDATTPVTAAGPTFAHTYATPGGYQVSVTANDTNGPGSPTITPFAWTVGTVLTSTLSATTVASGHQITTSARLTRADSGQVLAGRSITLQFQAAATTTWTTVATISTSATGTASQAVTPPSNGSYRWTYAGENGYTAATTPAARVSVSVAVATKVSATSIRYGTLTKITATATPHEYGATVQLQRLIGTKWVLVASARETSTGVVTFSTKLPKGSQQLRVVKTATTRYATSYSTVLKIKVS
jgi:hypothetical protein